MFSMTFLEKTKATVTQLVHIRFNRKIFWIQ